MLEALGISWAKILTRDFNLCDVNVSVDWILGSVNVSVDWILTL